MAHPRPHPPLNLSLRAALRGRRAGRASAVLALGLALLGGCEKSLAGNLPPDFTGVWDVTYDDSIEVEVQVGEQQLHGTVGEPGGRLSFHDAGVPDGLALDIDCSRRELVCPSEVWPRELDLAQAPGQVDRDGQQLAQSLVGQGTDRCSAQPGSVATAEVMNVATAEAVRTEAVALTSGRVRLVLSAACFDFGARLPADAYVVLSTGYTAAKR